MALGAFGRSKFWEKTQLTKNLGIFCLGACEVARSLQARLEGSHEFLQQGGGPFETWGGGQSKKYFQGISYKSPCMIIVSWTVSVQFIIHSVSSPRGDFSILRTAETSRHVWHYCWVDKKYVSLNQGRHLRSQWQVVKSTPTIILHTINFLCIVHGYFVKLLVSDRIATLLLSISNQAPGTLRQLPVGKPV